MFNREETTAIRSLDLSRIGIDGTWKARDLWAHADEGTVSGNVEAEIPSHGCKIIKLTPAAK